MFTFVNCKFWWGYLLRLISQQPLPSSVRKTWTPAMGIRPYLTRNNKCQEMFSHFTWNVVSRVITISHTTINVQNVAPLCGHKPGSPSLFVSRLINNSLLCRRQTRPQSDVASVVVSNISQINSKWSSSNTCWEFFHQFLGIITLKLIQVFLLNAIIFEQTHFYDFCCKWLLVLPCFIKTRKLQKWTLDTLGRFSVQKNY